MIDFKFINDESSLYTLITGTFSLSLESKSALLKYNSYDPVNLKQNLEGFIAIRKSIFQPAQFICLLFQVDDCVTESR